MKKILASLLGVVFSVSTFALPANVDQPFMEKAKNNLQDARGFLNAATADKGGHSNAAIAKINEAISSVNSGIAYDNKHRGKRPRRNSTDENINTDSGVMIDQPNMVRAREELQKAVDNLNNATADKGGWRNKALAQTRDAIAQVNAGIEFDRRN